MEIEILGFEGCPNRDALLAHLPGLLDGIDAAIVVREVGDSEAAVRERFLGSPTVRVEGRDVDPGAAAREDFGLKCRLYETATGLRGVPPDEWILEAIAAAQH